MSQKILDITIKKSEQYPGITYARHNFEHTPHRSVFDATVIGFDVHEVPPKPGYNLYKQAYLALKPLGKLLIFDYVKIGNMLLKPLY